MRAGNAKGPIVQYSEDSESREKTKKKKHRKRKKSKDPEKSIKPLSNAISRPPVSNAYVSKPSTIDLP